MEKLSPTDLQRRYLEEHGVFAHRANLYTWLKAPQQKLQQLDTNESIHSHACGEYVLEELQRGAVATDVVDGLLRKYLVETTVLRVVAYRKYREQSGAYWTVKSLERVHWRSLYDQVQLDIKLTEYKNYRTKVFQQTLLDVRSRFCAQVSLAEELLPITVLKDFYVRHDAYARLALEYPDATVHRDALPWATVGAYRETFAGQPMPSTLAVCMKSALNRARQVAAQGYVCLPRACASATMVCAYASLQCENLFRRQCWYRSKVPEANRSLRAVYPTVDFHFWVMYGSWSRCPHCGVMHYNDQYFSQHVYDDKASSSTPAESAGMRQRIPDDPVAHSDGNVGVWLIPEVFRNSNGVTFQGIDSSDSNTKMVLLV